MSLFGSNASIDGRTSLFTTSAEFVQSGSPTAQADGTRLLARSVLLLAIHDLGAWCRKCHHGVCHCRQVRQSAIAFLRGEPYDSAESQLSLWCEAAGWQEDKIKAFFSEGKEGIWIPFVIKLRSPYRRARRGASAPTEASVVDLLLAYRPNQPVETRMKHSSASRLIVCALAFVLALFAVSANANAQAVVNPKTAEYDPSADHPIVLKYEIGYFYGSATDPFFVSDLGKPACSPICSNPLPAKPAFGEFTAKVRVWALDFGGALIASEWSGVSNPFDLLPLPPSNPVLKK